MVGGLAVIAGVALVATVLVDMGLTVLHPTIRGPLSHRLTRLVWRLARAVARLSGRRVVLEFAGPLVTVALLAAWIVGLWLGFGLALVPAIGHFSSSVRLEPASATSAQPGVRAKQLPAAWRDVPCFQIFRA